MIIENTDLIESWKHEGGIEIATMFFQILLWLFQVKMLGYDHQVLGYHLSNFNYFLGTNFYFNQKIHPTHKKK